jgi:hypothetical protein
LDFCGNHTWLYDGGDAIEVFNRFWPKITSLRGPSKLIFSQPRKRFDKLSVVSVKSIGLIFCS